jgi:hypothetical protein
VAIADRQAADIPADLLIETCWKQEAGCVLRIEEIIRRPGKGVEAVVTCLDCNAGGIKRLSRLVRLLVRCSGCDGETDQGDATAA